MSRNLLFLVCSLQARGMNDWVDSKSTNGKPTFRRLANLSWLSDICNHFGDIAAWSPKSLKTVAQKVAFLEKDPLRANFHNCFPKDSCGHRSTSCVQISWNLADRNSVKLCVTWQKNSRKLSRSRFCTDRAQNLSQPAPDNRLGVPQILSKSVHLLRSYSRTRKHRWNAPQSVSNTRRRVKRLRCVAYGRQYSRFVWLNAYLGLWSSQPHWHHTQILQHKYSLATWIGKNSVW